MGHLEAVGLSYYLDDGAALLRDVSFRVGTGEKVALIGPNGIGKSTLLRLLSAELAPHDGTISASGGIAVMKQFIGTVRDNSTVRDLLVSLAPAPIASVAKRMEMSELRALEDDSVEAQIAYAQAVADWVDLRGFDQEVVWDICAVAAIGEPLQAVQHRRLSTLSGGEQKRLALEVLMRCDQQVLLLDEPDNYLDASSKEKLETDLKSLDKTVLFVTHDREMLTKIPDRICTLEPAGEGSTVWMHSGSFAGYYAARDARSARLEELQKRWVEERSKLHDLVQMYKQKAAYNSDMASRYQAALSRLRRFEAGGSPEQPPRPQRVRMQLDGSRSGKQVVLCRQLGLDGLMHPFDLDIRFGERVSVLGSNGTGKSHFLRLLAAGGSNPPPSRGPALSMLPDPVPHTGEATLGSRVFPGWFAQTHDHPELWDKRLVDVLHNGEGTRAGLARADAIGKLGRYGLARVADRKFSQLSGGQQARFQILMLELHGANLLLLDEPSDNLDLESVEALESALEGFEGTVIAVTHDRWFARGFHRHLVFSGDGRLTDSPDPIWA